MGSPRDDRAGYRGQNQMDWKQLGWMTMRRKKMEKTKQGSQLGKVRDAKLS